MTKSKKYPHLLKSHSLFAMFCLSYFPLFLLLSVKIILSKYEYYELSVFNWKSFFLFLKEFGFVVVLFILSVYAFLGTSITFKSINKKKTNSYPVKISDIKPKNEEALSYLVTYVVPLLAQGNLGAFEYISFVVLFIIYYKLYSSSSLILINPILNIKYGLFEINYFHVNQNKNIKNALIISKQKWIEEDEEISIIKLSHRLYFAY